MLIETRLIIFVHFFDSQLSILLINDGHFMMTITITIVLIGKYATEHIISVISVLVKELECL